jgi:hypothetical protein
MLFMRGSVKQSGGSKMAEELWQVIKSLNGLDDGKIVRIIQSGLTSYKGIPISSDSLPVEIETISGSLLHAYRNSAGLYEANPNLSFLDYLRKLPPVTQEDVDQCAITPVNNRVVT